MLPQHDRDEILYRFIAMREGWPGALGSERKAREMSEQQLAAVFQLLSEYDVFVEACAIDMGQHKTDTLVAFSRGQSSNIRGAVTPKHHPNLIREMHAMADEWDRLPPQLVAQVYALVVAMESVIRHAPNFFAQRIPAELGSFRWLVDAKDRAPTPYEMLWRRLIAPFLQSVFAKNPTGRLKGLDYSHLERYRADEAHVQEWLSRSDPLQPGETFMDIRKLVLQDLQVVQSETEPGIQIADIIANTLARAFNQRLDPCVWERLGRLFITRAPQVMRMVLLSADAALHGTRIDSFNYHGHVTGVLTVNSKSMWTRAGLALVHAAEAANARKIESSERDIRPPAEAS